MENSQQPQQQLDLLTSVRRRLLNQLVHAEVKNLLKLLVIDCVVRMADVKGENDEQDHD
jgi:hypothetical protein